jgi:quercetin dioxygenase-like cupin family protein
MTEKPYEVLGRYAQRTGFRISELRIGKNQEVPWHYHTKASDTFYVLEGKIRISAQRPNEEVMLAPGEVFQIQPERPHRVTNAGQEPAVFLLLQGVGEYDLVPVKSDH